MSTVRIQVRRGTAADWTAANPTLAAGEVGFDTTSNKMKVGDGSTAWSSLAYISSDAPGVSEIAQDAIAQALSVGSGLSKTYDDNANTISLAIDTATVQTRVANVSDTEIGYLDGVTSAIQTQLNAKAASADITELAQDAVNTALVAGSGISKAYNDAANTITVTNSGVLSFNTRTGAVTLSANDVNTALGYTAADAADLSTLTGNTAGEIADAITTAETYTDTSITTLKNDYLPNVIMDRVNNKIVNGNGITHTYANNEITVSANVAANNGVQSDIDNTGLITFSLENDISISGDFTSDTITTGVMSATEITATSLYLYGHLNDGGTTNTVNSSTLSVEDPMIYMAADNASNVLDLGVVGSYTKDSVYQHTGLVRDASENTWKLFTGVAAEPTTTVNFTGATYDNLLLGHIQSTSANIGDVSNEELQHLNGVTSAIQTQLDAKAPSASPTFTGVVTLPANTITQSMMSDDSVGTNEIGGLAITTEKIAALAVTTAKLADTSVTNGKLANTSISTAKIEDEAVTSAKIANGTILDIDINSAAEIAQSKIANLVSDLDLKALRNGPTFTGTVVLPSTTTIGNVSNSEISYLDGVTSAIQTQLDAKAASSALTNHTGATTSVHGIADTSALALTATVNSALDLKAPLANPTFTGTVSGVTKSHVGLGNADNTSDTAKPISTATQTALDLKAPLASPALTGVPTAPTAAAATDTTQIATTAYVRAEVAALVNSAGSTLDTLGEIATALGNDANLSTTLTNAIALKAPLANPTFTGTNTVAALTVSGSGLITASSAGIAFTDGTQTKEGTPSRTSIVQKTAAYTLSALTERDSLVEVNSASAVTVTVPANATVAYPVGTSIDILQTGAGQITVAGAVGVTINATPGLKLRTQWSGATLFKRATDTWVLYGDLSA